MRARGSRLFALALALGSGGCVADEAPDPALPDEAAEGDEFGLFARGGLELTRITIDQGVAVALVDDGALVPPSERRTSVIAGRPSVVRVLWTVPDDWEPRAIEARLTLTQADGSEQVATRELLIEGSAVENWIEGAFLFALPPELVSAGTSWQVGLYEVEDPPPGLLPPALAPKWPESGDVALEADPTPREIEVLIVPIDHEFDGGKACPEEPPSFDDARLSMFADALMAQTPVQRATVRVRDEGIVWSESAADLGKILDRLSQLREEDEAPAWLYYYGAIEPCDWGSDAGFAGQARVPREITVDEAWRRVAVGDVAVSESSTISTFVHEIGHTQGRRHVPCGSPLYAVEDYPYRDGMIGGYGFDVVRWTLHPPTHTDYMSYCDPSWLSDYGWNQVLPVTATLTGWQTTGASAPARPGQLVGALYGDGSEAWWTQSGAAAVDPRSADRVDYYANGRLLARRPASIEEREDGSVEIVASLPPEVGKVTQLRVISGRAEKIVSMDRVRRLDGAVTRPAEPAPPR